MRLVKVSVVSGASQTCFMPSFFEDEGFRKKNRNLFTNVLRHVSLLFRVMNRQKSKERLERW